jgi:hypothetical protein
VLQFYEHVFYSLIFIVRRIVKYNETFNSQERFDEVSKIWFFCKKYEDTKKKLKQRHWKERSGRSGIKKEGAGKRKRKRKKERKPREKHTPIGRLDTSIPPQGGPVREASRGVVSSGFPLGGGFLGGEGNGGSSVGGSADHFINKPVHK